MVQVTFAVLFRQVSVLKRHWRKVPPNADISSLFLLPALLSVTYYLFGYLVIIAPNHPRFIAAALYLVCHSNLPKKSSQRSESSDSVASILLFGLDESL